MSGLWRSWLPGRKHGAARGVGVFGPSSDVDPAQLVELLGECKALRGWAREHDVVLDDTPGSLLGLDQQLDAWSAEPGIGPRLGNEVGCYLGTVIVKNIPGSAWRAWPNGHPVVHLRSGRDLDVIAEAAHRMRSRRRSLSEMYNDVR
ncbi:DUF6278 family protein [Flexivirga oryzae]|uniref:Uncharacterized protein n=1 Tax=Flexivirga oryzae TaxID=1794944 RepID=A0A839N0G8_9MICO|nr:hypothetical protein [Flexivirga oryzae]